MTYHCYEVLDSYYKNPVHLQYKKMKLVLEYMKQGESLIDIGCGTGEFISRLKDRFDTIVGVDVSPSTIDFTSRKWEKMKEIYYTSGNWISFNFQKNLLMSVYAWMFLSMFPIFFPYFGRYIEF